MLRAPLAAALIGVLLILPGSATAHSGHAAATGKGKPTERELRRMEQRVLGAGHAAEHADLRRQQRADRRRGARPGVARRPARARAAAAGPPEQDGRWNEAFPIPILGVNAVMLPTGKVLLWAYPVAFKSPESHAYVWDPGLGQGAQAFKRVDPPIHPDTGKPANLWASGQSLLADGRVLVTGGNLAYPHHAIGRIDYAGLDRVYTFNPFAETWTEQPRMRRGRWYPTQILMPDGRTAIVSGRDETGQMVLNHDIEIFTPAPDLDGVGTLSMLGGNDVVNSPGGPPGSILTYPHAFWMPSGRALIAGQEPMETWFLNRPGHDGALSWSPLAPFSHVRIYGTGVLLPGGPQGSTKVMKIGGGSDTTAKGSVEVFDESRPQDGWQPAPSMQLGRQSHNTVLLPDGDMVTIGGGSETSDKWNADPALRQVELYDRASGTWRLGAAQAETRAYHSTALLLPDGRVMSAGDDRNGGDSADTAEIYEPPYLFKGPRPSISAAPDVVRWGQAFGVGSPDADVVRAVLVGLGATTHADDQGQRHVELQVTHRIAGQGVNVQAPATGDLAPPGYYMLFLLDARGVPSVARIVRLGPTAPDAGLIVGGVGGAAPRPAARAPQRAKATRCRTTSRAAARRAAAKKRAAAKQRAAAKRRSAAKQGAREESGAAKRSATASARKKRTVTRRCARKKAAPKRTARKPAARKPAARKPAARNPAARRTAPAARRTGTVSRRTSGTAGTRSTR